MEINAKSSFYFSVELFSCFADKKFYSIFATKFIAQISYQVTMVTPE